MPGGVALGACGVVLGMGWPADLCYVYWRLYPTADTCNLLIVFPEKPVHGYLGAQDGEEEGEEAVAEVVAPGRVDNEGAGDSEGGDDEEERDPEYSCPQSAPNEAGAVVRNLR